MTPLDVLGLILTGFVVGMVILALAILTLGPWILDERESSDPTRERGGKE